MAPRQPFRDSTKSRTLSAITPKTSGNENRARALFKYPLVPIFVGAGLGLASNVIAVLAALSVCLIWLCADLWPYAARTGFFLASYFVKDYRSHIGGYGENEARSKRNALRKSFTAIAFAVYCSFALLAYDLVVNVFLANHISGERAEVAQGIVGIPSFDKNNEPKFVFTNQSRYDISLIDITCEINSVTMPGSAILGSAVPRPFGNLIIRGGGDGQSSTCSVHYGAIVGSGRMTCGDITWRVHYTIADDPTKTNNKDYRFYLDPHTLEWNQIALSTPYRMCPES